MRTSVTFLSCLFVFCAKFSSVESHGRLVQPPGRSSAWRYGFSTPISYSDHELYCGGYSNQWGKNNGNCGICGDPYQMPRPRANENTGKYGTGVIVKKYKKGQAIDIGVQLTANHMGYFEFRLCVHNSPRRMENEDCFKYLLQRVDGEGARYFPGSASKTFYSKFLLPKDLTCTQCVLQWRYVAGNNWGRCENGTGKVGCGPQEEFRACSDIRIAENDGTADDTPARIPEIPEDDQDYNDIDVNVRKFDHDGIKNEPKHSKTGQIIALTLAFIFVLLLFLGLIFYYFWRKGSMKRFFKESTKPKWMSKVISTLTLSSNDLGPKSTINTYGNVNAMQCNNPIQLGQPVVPPRRNRPNSRSSENKPTSPTRANAKSLVTPIRRPILSISSPTKVSINGVEITPKSSSLNLHLGLHVPTKS